MDDQDEWGDMNPEEKVRAAFSNAFRNLLHDLIVIDYTS